jgi:hypothetical protein
VSDDTGIESSRTCAETGGGWALVGHLWSSAVRDNGPHLTPLSRPNYRR